MHLSPENIEKLRIARAVAQVEDSYRKHTPIQVREAERLRAILASIPAMCDCPDNADGPWDCLECPVHGADYDRKLSREQQSEIDAENAWLRESEQDWESNFYERRGF